MELLKGGYNRKYLDYVCRDNLGNLIAPNFVTDHFRFMVKKHNLKKLRFHDLRHSCASLLLANGISMKQIQEWLGHSTYNVTLQIYAHTFQAAQVRAMDTVANAISLKNSGQWQPF